MKKFDTYFQPEKDTNQITKPEKPIKQNAKKNILFRSQRSKPYRIRKGKSRKRRTPTTTTTTTPKKKISLGQKLALFTCKCLHCGKWVVRASHKGDPRRNPCRCIRRNRNNRIPWKTTERELYLCFCIKGCSGSKLPEGKVWCACLFFG